MRKYITAFCNGAYISHLKFIKNLHFGASRLQVDEKLAPSSPAHGPKSFRSSLLASGEWFFGCDTQRETAGRRRVAGREHTFVGRGS